MYGGKNLLSKVKKGAKESNAKEDILQKAQ
jgi:hypothetical protein